VAVNSAPFDTGLVIARLRLMVPQLQQVRGSAEYAAVTSMRDFRAPEAFVLLVRDQGGDIAGGARQATQAGFGVVIAARNYSDTTGQAAMDDARPLIGACRDALIGWVPQTDAGDRAPGARACRWVQGEVLDYDSSTLLWADTYTTQHFIGKPQ
jgi:hypothetical protein